MNDTSGVVLDEKITRLSWKPVPALAIYLLIPLFCLGLSVALFIAVVVHNVAFLLCLVLLSVLVVAFIVWNVISWKHRGIAISFFVDSIPETDLSFASEGQLVEITGAASCGSLSLESSYEKTPRCIYTFTLLYEGKVLGLRCGKIKASCCRWKLAYCERFSSDFHLTDRNSGIRAVVRAGSNCKVIPLVVETKLVSTSKKCKFLSCHLRKWLSERNLPVEARPLRLDEGYVQEGREVTVVGMLCKENGAAVIVQPPEPFSSGCLWRRLLLSVDLNGLILRISDMERPVTYQASGEAEQY